MNTKTFKTQEERIAYYYERYGMDGKFFLLTRDHTVEITTVGGGYDDVPIYEKGSLFHYANQVLYQKPCNEPDMFGRNYLDQKFIEMCMYVHMFLMQKSPDVAFHSLSTRKEGEKYFVRVRYDDVDIEMEVEEMVDYFDNLLKEEQLCVR